MKVVVDEDRCAGHGMCLTLCPEVFSMTDDGWAVADPGDVPAGLEPGVREAIDNCPERAIREID
ncbi:ferredoxin [Mycolicibacterium austroafricanum]|uniref:ferredoxin n=1 Tax=Mycolicibacterium austroafricanum TaxID=39687 RepID=UPI001CA37DAF|nr:ferredoxin [Mycolicibacterium austroafricanum]QZT61369.1 ferredoxin [Mycolicibacterium austroafricanum]